MKKYPNFILSLIMALSIFCSCTDDRGKAAEDVFEKYEGQEGVYIFRIPPGLIGIFVDGEKNPELKQSLRKMEMIKVMIFDKDERSKTDKNEILREFNEKLRESQFQDLLLMNEGEQTIRIKYREDEEEIIQEMMILITEEDTFLGLSMVGKIDLNQMTKVAKSMKIEDFQNVGK
jgi:hypothetical protein